MKTFTLEELARFVGGRASEVPGPDIRGARPVEYATESDITYVSDRVFLKKLEESSASAVLVPPDLDPGERPCIRVSRPEAAFARLTQLYYPYPEPSGEISPRADIHPDARLGRDVSIGPFAVIERGAVLGDKCVIGAHVVVGEDVQIGEATRIFPHVVIYPRVRIGKRVIVHSGTVLGSDGFGYALDIDANGTPMSVKKYHSGLVEILDDVELGALCAADRALAGATRLGKGVKVDNLVQVAHNVEIGDGTVIASQVGIAGSSTLGRYCMIGGQAGIRDHVAVGNGVVLAARVGIYQKRISDGSVMAGEFPPMRADLFRRVQAYLRMLPDMFKRIGRLERLVQSNRKDI